MTRQTVDGIYSEYLAGVNYKAATGLYETVRINEDFFVGRQWEGLYVEKLDPLIFNVIKRVVNLLVATVSSDDVAVCLSGLGTAGEESQKVLSAAENELNAVIECAGIKALNRDILRNACVDGDGCIYLYFDPTKDTSNGTKGTISAEVVENTRVIFANSCKNDVQSQPYIIVEMKKDLEWVKQEALRCGMPPYDADMITADSEDESGSKKITLLLKMYKKKGTVHFTKCTKDLVIQGETDTKYKLYPIAWMSWDKVIGSCHGQSPVTTAIPNQIAINKLYSMYVQCIKQMAFPKIIYDITRFPDGYSNDIGKAIGMRGNPSEAILSAFSAPEISSQVMPAIKQMMKDTVELMGASDVLLGVAPPENTSAIIALQKASLAPLELIKQGFYKFVEDYVRIIIDIMRADFGLREVRTEGADTSQLLDFSKLGDYSFKLNVEVGPSAYWSELVQGTTNDNLFRLGIIKDPEVYVENIPSSQLRGKTKIIKAIREEKDRLTMGGERK